MTISWPKPLPQELTQNPLSIQTQHPIPNLNIELLVLVNSMEQIIDISCHDCKAILIHVVSVLCSAQVNSLATYRKRPIRTNLIKWTIWAQNFLHMQVFCALCVCVLVNYSNDRVHTYKSTEKGNKDPDCWNLFVNSE